jgi:radical SAM protein with 4Fe4S-binding SPASM domain
MMKSNYLLLAEVARAVKCYQAPLRVNVYQAVRSDLYALSYEEYWKGFRALFAETDVIAIGEPLVRAMAGLPPRTGGCGVSTVRVTPRATTQPCVYWPGAGEPLSLVVSLRLEILETPPFVEARTVPEACRSCVYLDSCSGGCAGRRRIQNALHEPDIYCPVVRGQVQKLEIRMAAARELPKGESACTTIVIARN